MRKVQHPGYSHRLRPQTSRLISCQSPGSGRQGTLGARLPPHEPAKPPEPLPKLRFPRRHADVNAFIDCFAISMDDGDASFAVPRSNRTQYIVEGLRPARHSLASQSVQPTSSVFASQLSNKSCDGDGPIILVTSASVMPSRIRSYFPRITREAACGQRHQLASPAIPTSNSGNQRRRGNLSFMGVSLPWTILPGLVSGAGTLPK